MPRRKPRARVTPEAPRYSSLSNRLTAKAAPAVLLLLFGIFLSWSWRKWPDILVDFGRELYVPWQMSVGKVLYRDLAHLFGPLSSYAHALLFYLFGASYTVLIIANSVTLMVLIYLLYRMLENVCSLLAAFLSCAVVICIFSFSQYVFIGNYNFISPYSHEATHGIVLSLIMIYQMWKYIANDNKSNLIMAGVAFGLIYLTKADILFSALMTTGLFFFLYWFQYRRIEKTLQSVAIMFVGSCIPIILFFIYFLSVMDLSGALRAVNGAWIALMGTDITKNKFYISGMGLDNVGGNLLRMVLHSSVAAVAGVLLIYLSHQLIKHKRNSIIVLACIIGLFGVICSAFFINPYTVGYSLPVITFMAFLLLFYSYLKSVSHNLEQAVMIFPMLLWAFFSLGLLWKMILFCRLYHYGFYLSLPAVVLFVCVMTYYVPKWLDGRFLGASLFRYAVIIMLMIATGIFIRTSNKLYELRTLTVGTGGDSMQMFKPGADARGVVLNQAVEWIKNHIDPSQTIAALPEGVMINYLSRRANSTPYTNFMMGEMLAYGEERMLEAFAASPPDFVAVVHKDTSEHGVRFFGQDPSYGERMMEWITKHYRPHILFGDEPLKTGRFGIKILRSDFGSEK